jgi:hypothetical protein
LGRIWRIKNMMRGVAYLLFTLVLMVPCGKGWAQYDFEYDDAYGYGDLPLHDNGLVYSAAAIERLRAIADSLHEQWREREEVPTYHSLPQGRAHVVCLRVGDLDVALADMEAGLGFEAFLQKYPEAEVQADQLVILLRKSGGGGLFRQVLANDYGVQIAAPAYQPERDLAGRWVAGKELWKRFLIWGSGEESHQDERVEAFFFPQGLQVQPLSAPYARMVAYVDALVDTGIPVYLNDAERPACGSSRPRVSEPVDTVLRYAHRVLAPPAWLGAYEWHALSKKAKRAYDERRRHWRATRHEQVAQVLAKDTVFMSLLEAAVAHALQHGDTNYAFEFLVEHAYDPATALLLKRRRRVMGACSADAGPQLHMAEIARLAAETGQWPVFLRAHLNILDDRFDRASDGSYAEAERATYLRELEALNIEVVDFLIGANLRLQHPDARHYYGNLGRAGRALAEAQDLDQVESRLEQLIEDEGLDDYNRLLAYRLFWVYSQHLEGARKARVAERLHKIKGE